MDTPSDNNLTMRLCYSPDVDPRGEEKERPAKNNLAAHSRKGEAQTRVAVLERGAH